MHTLNNFKYQRVFLEMLKMSSDLVLQMDGNIDVTAYEYTQLPVYVRFVHQNHRMTIKSIFFLPIANNKLKGLIMFIL